MKRVRCAIYTRKSSEEGLEQDFNSLDAQREACEAYIASQKHEGWELLPDYYDDGGISGGHLDCLALQRLMQAVDEKRIDQIVVYKINRLTRSLADFAKLVDRLDAAETSFVSVTQSFNTATSMGRLTLNMLLSFAQFEREVTAERIRDKIAASKRKGMWMGGSVPLGYQPDGRTLKIDEEEAKTVKTIFKLYSETGNLRDLKTQAQTLNLRSRCRVGSDGTTTGGKHFNRGHLHHILTNPIYAGRIRHKDKVYEGQHPAIIDPHEWDKVQDQLQGKANKSRGAMRRVSRSRLAGKLFDETGDRLTPSHSRKNGKRLRYYISHRLVKDRSKKHPVAWRLPAEQIETLLCDLVAQHLSKPDTALAMTTGLQGAEISKISDQLKTLHDSKKLLQLIEKVDIRPGQLSIQLDQLQLGRHIHCEPLDINTDALVLTSPFQMRRCGVELKLHLGVAPPEIDETLVQNIAKARGWMKLIIGGKTFTEIAELEDTSKRRIQDLIDLAMLAPDVLDQIAAGEQPLGLTSDYLIKKGFSPIWSEQREQFVKF